MIACTINGINFKMHTEMSLFSPNSIDKGTLTMLSKVDFQPGQKILDLGCGYGVIGIYAAHFSGAENVTMVDINPPYHANFDVPKKEYIISFSIQQHLQNFSAVSPVGIRSDSRMQQPQQALPHYVTIRAVPHMQNRYRRSIGCLFLFPSR